LLRQGHPVNERDNLNWLPIHEACNYGHVEIVEALIKYGAKLNDMMGPMPPLHDVCAWLQTNPQVFLNFSC
jgi:NF-kappa-B inhibitor-like protein 2